MRQGKDPDPEGPKTTYGSGCGSGSGILVLTINNTVGEKFHLPLSICKYRPILEQIRFGSGLFQ
jgi:hypothetical protein